MISNGQNDPSVKGIDISITKLVPRNERQVAKKYRQRIEASLRAVGLIEPLIVFPLNDGYEILDGTLRYRILLDLGVESVPCLIHSTRDGFTGNRMVNQLSASQEMRMLRKSLEETGKLSKNCARELRYVKPERQLEILELMESCNDFSTTFARGLVLKTAVAKRAKASSAKTPWTKADEKKSQLLKKLQEAEQQQDFYTGLYRQYTTNLLKLVIYVRSLMNNAEVKSHLQTHHADLTRIFEDILASTEG